MAVRLGDRPCARSQRTLGLGATHRVRERRDQSRARSTGRHDRRGPHGNSCTLFAPEGVLLSSVPSKTPLVFASHTDAHTRVRSQNINAGLQNAQFASWESLKIAMPLSDAAGPPAPTPTGDDKAVMVASSCSRSPTYTAAMPRPAVRTAKKVTDVGTPDGESSTLCTPSYCVSPGGTELKGKKSKSATTLRRLSKSSFTKKCVKMVPLANVLSKLSSSLSPSTSSRSPSSRGAAAARSNVANSYSPRGSSRICDDYGDDDVRSSASSSSWCPLPAEPPPPYQLRVANPAPGRGECIESGNADVGHRPRPTGMSSSRFTTASVEAVRAPDSPVPVFPSPKLSTDSVFGSTQSISSMSSGNGISPRSCCTRRNSAADVRPVLRRKDTIRFGRRMTLDDPIVKPVI